jgi:hypothetical protein
MRSFLRSYDTPKPLKRIPTELIDGFTMNKRIPVLKFYLDDRVSAPVCNTSSTYKNVFTQLKERTFEYYGKEVLSFYDAFEDYNLSGKTALIFGLAGCNCDAMAVWQNAKHVYVVDYNKPICEHDKITVLDMDELKATDLKVDYAFSFSSFEHDGLGRYGDPISHDADFRAMQRAKNVVKPGGIMFLGVPIGRDCLVWNAHRIYGKLRLPLLLRGWLCLDVYYPEKIRFFEEPPGGG